jgi:hypothetical protein
MKWLNLNLVLFVLAGCSSSRLEKIDISQLEKIESGTVKLAANQKIVPMNTADSIKIFVIETRSGDSLSTIEIEKKYGQIISIEKIVIRGDTTELCSYHRNGWLKQKKTFLVTPWSNDPPSKFSFDHVRIGIEYTGSTRGKLLSRINYPKVFAYSLDSILAYCKDNFPDSRSIGIQTYYYKDANDIDTVTAKIMKTSYPYWSLWVQKKCDSTITHPMTICVNTYLIDGKTGKILHQSPLAITSSSGPSIKRKTNNFKTLIQ